jgi:MFS family permease
MSDSIPVILSSPNSPLKTYNFHLLNEGNDKDSFNGYRLDEEAEDEELIPEKRRRNSMQTEQSRLSGRKKVSTIDRYIALGFACLITLGGHYCKHSLGPLKPYFIRNFGYSNTAFGTILASPSSSHLFMPVVAGIFIDNYYGHEIGGLVLALIAFTGNTLFLAFITLITTTKDYRNFYFILAILGRIIFGLGSAGGGIVQGSIISHWFNESGLSLALGIAEGAVFLSSFCGKALPALLVAHFESTDHTENQAVLLALWFSDLLLFLAGIVAFCYLFFAAGKIRDRPFKFELSKAPNNYGTIAKKEEETKDETIETIGHFQKYKNRLGKFPTIFWLFCILHMVFSNSHNLFGGFSVSMMNDNGLDTKTAALYASLDSFLPIFFAPLTGVIVDKFGGRMYLLAIASLCLIIGYGIFLSNIAMGKEFDNTMFAMAILSVPTCVAPALLKSAVMLVIPDSSYLGSALGLFVIIASIGAIVGHIVCGRLRDISKTYISDLVVLEFMAISAFLVCLVCIHLDKKLLGRKLNSPMKNLNVKM